VECGIPASRKPLTSSGVDRHKQPSAARVVDEQAAGDPRVGLGADQLFHPYDGRHLGRELLHQQRREVVEEHEAQIGIEHFPDQTHRPLHAALADPTAQQRAVDPSNRQTVGAQCIDERSRAAGTALLLAEEQHAARLDPDIDLAQVPYRDTVLAALGRAVSPVTLRGEKATGSTIGAIGRVADPFAVTRPA